MHLRMQQYLHIFNTCTSCAVYKQGRLLKPRKTAQHHAWRFDDGAYIEIIWELYKPGLGNTIEIETGETPGMQGPDSPAYQLPAAVKSAPW